jgi:hypothetical protein
MSRWNANEHIRLLVSKDENESLPLWQDILSDCRGDNGISNIETLTRR